MKSSRVCSSMARRLGALIFALALAPACGGKNKDAKTTPDKPKSGDSQSMNDPGDPTDPGGGATAPGGGTTTPGGTGGTGGPTAGGESGPPNDGSDPPVTLPNFDIDPAQARAQVEQHLSAARAALSSPTPDAEGALKQAQQALQIDAANVDAAAMVAFAYYHKKLYDTAELVLDDLFKREAAKQNANVYYVFGLVYDQTGRADRAVLAYKKAVELNPNHASALVNLGVHQLRNTQYGEAQRTFERLTQQFNRNDAITLTSLGSAYRGRSADYRPGAPERDQLVRSAEAAYKRAMQANASYGPAYYNLGLLYLDTDPYPGISDPILRLTTAKTFFDQYKNMPGVDIKLFDSRMKDVDKAIKRAEKQKKTKSSSKKGSS
ncbi:MAG: tetratricopeptide repeat protein [Kofleriaceae bacterium]